ncbi:hypothetical protein JAAARDRAFT_212127 [Jaapia argillacea MUCL 33604]|uniref:F-box domain-containing protein n=1 Tax=Jaapia argillacea MUCL 33604 TaxID=933084 RepID=A0A067P435_9AGAM|nr:hypothetical protein JAAARDRAFT_212127 [Jaapia argillacea MUCL 33604]
MGGNLYVKHLLNLIPVVEERPIQGEREPTTAFEFIRPPIPEDWERLDHYRYHVRALRCEDFDFIDGHIFYIIGQYRPGPLFPRLRFLSLRPDYLPIESHKFILQYSPFLTATLRDLEICAYIPDPPGDADEWAAFTHTLPLRCPNIQDFSFIGLPISSSLSFLGHFRYLRRLNFFNGAREALPELDSFTFDAISQLTYLTDLTHLALYGARIAHLSSSVN